VDGFCIVRGLVSAFAVYIILVYHKTRDKLHNTQRQNPWVRSASQISNKTTL